jgi:hypothetical protein
MARVKTGKVTFYTRNGTPVRTFTPTGAMRPNKVAWTSSPVDTARLFVGFNVGLDAYWTLTDVVRMVREVRREQRADPSSSFVAQKGVYRDKTGKVVEEDGAQVIVMNLSDTRRKQFEEEMLLLGDHLRYEMDQDEVIVEFQHGGVVYKTVGLKEKS